MSTIYDESYPPYLWGAGPVPDPRIFALVPPSFSAGDGVMTVRVEGRGFFPHAIVEVDQVEIPTVFVSSSLLTVTYDPEIPGSKSITVRQDPEESNPFTFTVTALEVAAAGGGGSTGGRRKRAS
jgi:hypothetical protein